MGRLTAGLAAGTILVLGLAAGAGAASATGIRNGSFTEGAGGVPDKWRTEAWARDLARFQWEIDPEGVGMIGITNVQPNDARWCQPVSVKPGASYRVSARVKTSDVGADTAGALIAIEPRVADSPDLRGTNDWHRLDVVAQAKDETTWDVCARLGSYANLNTGTAWFTDFTLVQIGEAAPLARRWRMWQAWSGTSWYAVMLPIVAGLLLGFGLGIFWRPRSWES
jgi:hypothetical protein